MNPPTRQASLKTWSLFLILLFVGGCASTPSYEKAFSSEHQVRGSTETISASLDTTWGSTLEVLAQQGFLVQQADSKSRIIMANKDLRETEDKDFSYTISATLTLVPVSDQITRVIVAANQTTELHKKEYRWWKLLWLIPLIPYGTDYTTVVVNRDTVQSPRFYQDLFSAVKRSCDEKQGVAEVAPGAELKTAPAGK